MKKNQEIRVRVSLEEKNKIEEQAKRLGLEPSVYLRVLGLSSKIEIKSAIFA